MHRHNRRTLLGLVAALMLIIGPLTSITAVQAARTSDSGVVGNSYVSPDFGYSINWDSSWEVSDESIESGYNFLQLDNDLSTVYIEGFSYDGTADDCVAMYVENLAAIDGVSNVAERRRAGGSEDGHSWTTVDFVFAATDGDLELTENIDCYDVEPAVSMAGFRLLAATADFEDSVPAYEELMANFAVDGSTGPTQDNNGTTEEQTPEPAPSGGDGPDILGLDLSQDDQLLVDYIVTFTTDVEQYWGREYPNLHNGDAYGYITRTVIYDSDEGVYPDGADESYAMNAYYDTELKTMNVDLALVRPFLETATTETLSLAQVAIIIAHELGHHIQELAGYQTCIVTPCLDPTQMTGLEGENMADCYAGSWAADAQARGRIGEFDAEYAVSLMLNLGNAGDVSATIGAHGTGALRAYWFLGGYFKGPSDCLSVSSATDPARNGTASTPTNNEPTDTPTEQPTDEPTNNPSADLTVFNMGEDVVLELPDYTYDGVDHSGESITLNVDSTETGPKVETKRSKEGMFVTIYIIITWDGSGGVPFPFADWQLVDGDGNVYDYSSPATDALMATAFDNGEDEPIDANIEYTIGIVFDVPETASDLSLVHAASGAAVTLDI